MKCLYCYKDLAEGQKNYHPACARKFFGVRNVPSLPYVRAQLGDLARKVVRSQTTLTGVQAKLSLDIDRGEKASWREVGIHMRKYMTPGEEDLREGYAFRHGENQANVAFVDGHVDARKWAEIPSDWNSDGGVFWSGDKQ